MNPEFELSKPSVSVLMPVYNAGNFLADALESILNQTYGDFELIIVDDGSTDSTAEILSEFQNKDKRIRVFRNRSNLGIVQTLNKGISHCSGKYIARMDADDISKHDRFEKQIHYMERNPEVSVLGASVSYIDAEGTLLNVIRQCKLDRSLLSANPLLHPSVVMRKKILDETGARYEEKYRYAEDYYLWLLLSRIGRIHAISDVVLYYRLSSHATRVKNLKGVIWATLIVKWDAVFKLKMKPTLFDISRFFSEMMLLFLPASIILKLYMISTFGLNNKIPL